MRQAPIRNKQTLFMLILVLAAIIYLAGLNPLLPLQEDSGLYIMMGNGVVNSIMHASIARPGAGNIHYYPYAYPTMLAPLLYLFPGNYLALKLLSVFLALLLVIIFYFLAKRLFGEELSILVICLFALSPQISMYARQILTEIPYTFFSLLGLYLLVEHEERKRFSGILLFGSIALCVLSLYIRFIGLSLLIAGGIFFLLKKEYKKARIYAFVCLLLVVLWVYKNIVLVKSNYAGEFLGSTTSFFSFAHRYVYNALATIGKELPDLFFYPFFSGIDPYEMVFVFKFLLGCLILALIIYGFVLKIRKQGIGVAEIYVTVYCFVFYLSWTHHGARYLVPILAFLLYYIVLAVKALARRKEVFYAAVTLFIISSIAGNIKETLRERMSPFTPIEQSFISAVDWLNKNVPQDSLVLSRRQNWVYLYTGHLKGFMLLRTKNTKEQYEFILNNKINYIIIDQSKIYRDDARDYLFPLVNDYKNNFEKVYASAKEPRTYIYKVKR